MDRQSDDMLLSPEESDNPTGANTMPAGGTDATPGTSAEDRTDEFGETLDDRERMMMDNTTDDATTGSSDRATDSSRMDDEEPLIR